MLVLASGVSSASRAPIEELIEGETLFWSSFRSPVRVQYKLSLEKRVIKESLEYVIFKLSLEFHAN